LGRGSPQLLELLEGLAENDGNSVRALLCRAEATLVMTYPSHPASPIFVYFMVLGYTVARKFYGPIVFKQWRIKMTFFGHRVSLELRF